VAHFEVYYVIVCGENLRRVGVGTVQSVGYWCEYG